MNNTFGLLKTNVVVTSDITDDAVTIDKVDKGVLQVAEHTLTVAEVQALHTTAIDLVPDPPSGYMNVPVGEALFDYKYATSAFTGVDANDDIQILYYNGGSSVALYTYETTGTIDQTSSKRRHVQLISGQYATATDKIIIKLASSGNGITGGGTSTILVRLHYRVEAYNT